MHDSARAINSSIHWMHSTVLTRWIEMNLPQSPYQILKSLQWTLLCNILTSSTTNQKTKESLWKKKTTSETDHKAETPHLVHKHKKQRVSYQGFSIYILPIKLCTYFEVELEVRRKVIRIKILMFRFFLQLYKSSGNSRKTVCFARNKSKNKSGDGCLINVGLSVVLTTEWSFLSASFPTWL